MRLPQPLSPSPPAPLTWSAPGTSSDGEKRMGRRTSNRTQQLPIRPCSPHLRWETPAVSSSIPSSELAARRSVRVCRGIGGVGGGKQLTLEGLSATGERKKVEGEKRPPASNRSCLPRFTLRGKVRRSVRRGDSRTLRESQRRDGERNTSGCAW